jgi:hypothetical protein
MSNMVAVCGRCNVPIELHPVESCDYEYAPIVLNGRRYGWRMVKRKIKNGDEEDQTIRA